MTWKKTALVVVVILANFAVGLYAGYAAGWNTRDHQAMQEFDASYHKGFEACQDQF